MSVLHRKRTDPDSATSRPDPDDPSVTPPSSATEGVPRTRTGAAWFGACVAAVASVLLTIFLLQNTGDVEITFLWMRGSVPLALALLVAGVGVAIITTAVGAARIGQLRRLANRRRQGA